MRSVIDVPRWVASVRFRPAAFVSILLLSTGAGLIAATTPMLVVAIDAVSLRQSVAEAPFPEDGVSVAAVAQVTDELAEVDTTVLGVLTSASGTSDRWGAPRQVDELEVIPHLFGPARAPFPAHLALAPFDCAGLKVTGRCPANVFEGLLPRSLAHLTGWTAGTTVKEEVPKPAGGDPPFTTLGVLTVVGTYDDTTGFGAVAADPTRLIAKAPPRSTPDLVVGQHGYRRLHAPVQVTGGVRIVRPVLQSDLAALRRGVAAAHLAATDSSAAQFSTTVSSGLSGLLEGVEERRSASIVLATPIGVQALLLAWFAVGAVAQRTARSRAAEWGVSRMRGARVRAWLRFVFTEPLLAVLLGTVTGYAAALLASRLAATLLLGTAEDITPLAPAVLIGVGLSAAGSLFALVLSSVRAALLPLPQLLQDTAEPRRLTRVALVVQVALLSVTVTVVVSAITATRIVTLQLGLLTPAMLALAVGLIAVQVAVLVVRRGSERPPHSLGRLVVGRGLARAPSVLVSAQVILVSSALAACAVQLALFSQSVQVDRAQLAVGASRVLTVRAPAGVSLLDAVRRADPSGRVAMAAEEIAGDRDDAGDKVLAVDTARIARVSSWRADWREGADLTALVSDDPGLELRGTRLHLDVARAVQGSLDDSGSTSVRLGIELSRPDGWTTIDLGRPRVGRLTAAIPCADGCRLVALTFDNGADSQQPWVAQLTVTALSTDRQPASTLRSWLRSDRWRDRVVDDQDPTRPARALTFRSSTGLVVQGRDRIGSSTTQLEPATGPQIVPAIVGTDADLVGFPGIRSAVIGTSLADAPILVRPISRVVAVPRALRTGVIVDLGTMLRSEDPSLVVADQQVWLAPGEHPAVLAALEREGVRITGSERRSAAEQAGLDTPMNRVLRSGIAVGVLGMLFGVLTLVATRVIDAGERRREWATLRLAGTADSRLRTLAVVQMVAPSLIGVALGVATGAAAASLIAARLPVTVGVSLGPPLDLSIRLLPLLGLTAALSLSLVVVAIVVARTEVRDGR